MEQSEQSSGPDLRKERRLGEVSVTALAHELSRPRQFIHELEGRAFVDAEIATEYRAAVAKLRKVSA